MSSKAQRVRPNDNRRFLAAVLGVLWLTSRNAEYNKMRSTKAGSTLDAAFRGFYSAFS